MKRIHIPAAVLALGLLLGAASLRAEEEIGLPVGHDAPAFALEDQRGDTQTLDGLLAGGPLAIVFFRAADWCPYIPPGRTRAARSRSVSSLSCAFKCSSVVAIGRHPLPGRTRVSPLQDQ